MPILKDTKSYLEFIGKDTTLLSVAIVLLFVENIAQLSYEKSLINDERVDFSQLFNFKFLFGFVIFIFACKPLFILVWQLLNYFPFYKLEFSTSYKVGFGCFVLSILLFFHAWYTDHSNEFLTAISKDSYKTLTTLLGIVSLFFSSVCDWTDKDSKSNPKEIN